MLIAFFAGVVVALIGFTLSFATGEWYISFGISALTAIIPVLIASIFKNLSLVFAARVTGEDKRKNKVFNDLENYSRVLTLFAMPNIILAVFLYYKLFIAH